jgi:hypothetical protein
MTEAQSDAFYRAWFEDTAFGADELPQALKDSGAIGEAIVDLRKEFEMRLKTINNSSAIILKEIQKDPERKARLVAAVKNASGELLNAGAVKRAVLWLDLAHTLEASQ